MTNGTFAVLDDERFLPDVPGRTRRDFSIWDFEGGGKKFFTVFPYFHLAGFLSLVVNPLFTEASSPVIGPALMPPSGALMMKILKQQKVRALYIPPSIAEQMLAEPDGIDYFKELDFICYTGGPFSPDAGQELIEVTDLVPLYGSTEAFQTPQLVPPKEDWAYMEWNPHFKFRMELTEDGAYELVLLTDETTEKTSALNHNVPGTSEWWTRDLFKSHPTKPNLWKYYGRRDDIIVFSNGEKFNPVALELLVGGHSALSGVLVVGQGRLQAAVLLEPKPGNKIEHSKLLEEVWALIDRANTTAPAQGRIVRSKILVIESHSFIRAGKGTVIRKLSERQLQAEVDALYLTDSFGVSLKQDPDHSGVETFVKHIVNDVFAGEIGLDDDFFTFGLDSLKSTVIVQNMKAGIKSVLDPKSLDWISLDSIYRYPSIRQISEILFQYLASGTAPSISSNQFSEDIAAAILDYTIDFPEASSAPSKEPGTGLTIALTGSNGALGTALLEHLVGTEAKIYCLNRRHVQKHEVQYSTRVKFLKIQAHEKQLGLSDPEYQTLRSEVDIIIHNAWQLDFSLPLKAFAKQLLGVRNLIALSLQSPRRPRIVFFSSVSSVMNWPLSNPEEPEVPERIIDDCLCAFRTGYSASKFVAEQILAKANEQRSVDVMILRLGQIIQPGDFSRESERRDTAWIPGFFESARRLGCFPVDICDVDFLGIEEAAGVAFELSTQTLPRDIDNGGELRVYNIVNSEPCTWEGVLPLLNVEGLTTGILVSLKDWVVELRGVVEGGGDEGRSLPSLRIVGFFDALGDGKKGLRYETIKSREDSSMLRSLPPVDSSKLLGWET